jgi:hypothetical protein
MNWTAFLRRINPMRSRNTIEAPDTTAPDADAREAFVARIKATLAA